MPTRLKRMINEHNTLLLFALRRQSDAGRWPVIASVQFLCFSCAAKMVICAVSECDRDRRLDPLWQHRLRARRWGNGSGIASTRSKTGRVNDPIETSIKVFGSGSWISRWGGCGFRFGTCEHAETRQCEPLFPPVNEGEERLCSMSPRSHITQLNQRAKPKNSPPNTRDKRSHTSGRVSGPSSR